LLADTDGLSDIEILAKTIYGENRSSGAHGMANVASVVLNRVNSGINWWGNTIRTVCLCPWQFSTWNADDPNRPKIMAATQSDLDYSTAIGIAMEAFAGTLPDSVNAATSYFARSMATPPKWAAGLTPVAEDEGQLYFCV